MSDVTLPQTIDAPTVTTSEVQSNFEALRDFVNGTDWLTAEKVPNAELTDAKLASPNNVAYRHVARASSLVPAGSTAAHYALRGGNTVVASGASLGTAPAEPFILNAAHYVVAGKTTKLRVKGFVFPNDTQSAITFTIGLYSVLPVSGSNPAVTMTFVTGSSVALTPAAFVAPSATNGVGTDFTLDPVSGGNFYMLGVQLSGTAAVSSTTTVVAELEMRHV